MPTGSFTSPPAKDSPEPYTESNWDTHFKGNMDFIKSYLDELGDGIAKAQITANVGAGASEAAPNDVISLPSFTFTAATDVIIEFSTPRFLVSGTSGINIWNGGADIGRLWHAVAAAVDGGLHVRAPVSLASGTHSTLKIRLWGTATVHAGAGGPGTYLPAFARVTHA